VITGAGSAAHDAGPPPLSWTRVVRLGSIVFLGALPLVVLAALFVDAIGEDAIAFDFRPFYAAAEAILRGESPYPGHDDPLTASAGPYVYPPLPAIVSIPLTALPFDAAGLLLMAGLAGAALATLFVLGVRDWRCYGIVLLWPPVISAIQTGNVTLWLALASAIAWRFRARVLPVSGSIGLTLAVKFLLWPLVVWLAATRRYAAAVLSGVVGVGLLLLSWAAIGFAGFADYPDLLRRLEDTVGEDSYTLYIVGLDLGLPSAVSRSLWLAVGLALLAAVVLLARRGDERRAFVLAIAASLALTPIVWLHYFALLVVVVGLARPKLGLIWFVPLAMVVTPGSGHPTPFETAATLAVAAATIALALRAAPGSVGLEEGHADPSSERAPVAAT
jgi:Glycosyltransferase family 87